MHAVEYLDELFNFFDVKSYNYARVAYSSAYFDRNQLFWWKVACGVAVLALCVILPSLTLPWDGFSDDEKENIPVLLFLSPSASILCVISLAVSAVNLCRPPFDSTRLLVYRKHLGFFSWEVVGWILHEASITHTLVVVIGFWVITFPSSNYSAPVSRIVGNLSLLALMIMDFFISGTQFKGNHVILMLGWPSVWLMVQTAWVLSGHSPCYQSLNFRTYASPISVVLYYGSTAISFYFLRWYARHIRQPFHTRRKKGKRESEHVDTMEEASDSGDSARLAQYELMEDPSNRYFNYSQVLEEDEDDAPNSALVSADGHCSIPIESSDGLDTYSLDDSDTESPSRTSNLSNVRGVSFKL